MTTSNLPVHVVKLGGSLLDMPNLIERIEAYCRTQPPAKRLLLIGGGRTADTVRMFDRHFHLDEHQGHWLAVRAMQFNAHLFAAAVPHTCLAHTIKDCQAIWVRSQMAIVEPLAWLEDEEARGVTVPHLWQFTSDSIAAHIATQLDADRLTLLKSTLPDREVDMEAAAAHGIVDECFPQAAAALKYVELVNLRADPWERRTLRRRLK